MEVRLAQPGYGDSFFFAAEVIERDPLRQRGERGEQWLKDPYVRQLLTSHS
ncbi:hypothetical protein [Micromonospora chersina]|uniref:hypothetical protein n=1 Tax=Micromonospora chersina TaxID=47854 RepID=UPI0037241F0A